MSRLPSALPLTELGLLLTMPDMGVWGGVVHGRPLNDGLLAATLGTLPRVGVGLLTICDDRVATDDVELERVGLGGGSGAGEADGANTGVGCLSNDGGADTAVGVGTGVACADDVVEIGAGDGWCAVGTWPVKTCPSSPGAKVRFEQKPSDELMSKVRPSLDLYITVRLLQSTAKSWEATNHVRSVKVAKCRLLTTMMGYICCVSYTSTASCVATA